jgi:hypothetical protein
LPRRRPGAARGPKAQKDKYIEKKIAPQVEAQMKDIEFDNEADKLKIYTGAVSTKTAKEWGTKHASRFLPFSSGPSREAALARRGGAKRTILTATRTPEALAAPDLPAPASSSRQRRQQQRRLGEGPAAAIIRGDGGAIDIRGGVGGGVGGGGDGDGGVGGVGGGGGGAHMQPARRKLMRRAARPRVSRLPAAATAAAAATAGRRTGGGDYPG